MTIATPLRLSLCGAALSAISIFGLVGCSNSATETTTDDAATGSEKPAKTLAITQIVEHPSLAPDSSTLLLSRGIFPSSTRSLPEGRQVRN